MDSKPQKPPFLFANPFSALTELTFKLWGFGKPPEPSTAEKPAVAVIPTKDAKAHGARKRPKAKVRGKSRAKRARR
jgi:hypothetical protein